MSAPHSRPGWPGVADANHQWKGEDAGYFAALKRLRRAKGSASSYACSECGLPAFRWVLVGEGTHKDAEHGWPYSLDHDDYTPLCARCHRIGNNAP